MGGTTNNYTWEPTLLCHKVATIKEGANQNVSIQEENELVNIAPELTVAGSILPGKIPPEDLALLLKLIPGYSFSRLSNW